MRPYLEALVKRTDLTLDQAKAAASFAVGGNASEAEIAALVSLLSAKGETADEITGFVSCFRERMVPVEFEKPVLDIVGTGGDGFNTVNISTAASVLAAAAGCLVAKHGNRSVSSKSGSADVLQALGIELSLTPNGVADCIRASSIGFMFAPNHHPSLKHVGPIRKALKIPTVFNIIGPFLNPCLSEYAVIGVNKPKLLDIAADVLLASGLKRGAVVHTEGMDEFSNTGIAQVVFIDNGVKKAESFDAQKELDIPRVSVDQLRGGDAKENAQILLDVLGGKRKDAISDAIALNAAVGCWAYGLDASIADGFQRVQDVLASGKAVDTLHKWAQASQSASKM